MIQKIEMNILKIIFNTSPESEIDIVETKMCKTDWKNIILFGDVHESTENMCIRGSNSKLLYLFIDEIIYNTQIQFDIVS